MKATRITYFINNKMERIDLPDDYALELRNYLREITEKRSINRTANGILYSAGLHFAERSIDLREIIFKRFNIIAQENKLCTITYYTRGK